MNNGPATTPVDTMSSEGEPIPSSPPTRTIFDQHKNVRPNTWQADSNYPSLNSEFAIEDMRLSPIRQPKADDIDKENMEFIRSKSNTMASAAAPRPLPKTPLVNLKADDHNLAKLQGGQAFDSSIGGMISIAKSEEASSEPGNGSVTANSAAARGAAFLVSLAPHWAEKRGVTSKKRDQEDENWLDETVVDHKTEAVARLERFLAGGDELVPTNNQPLVDLEQAQAPKTKKNKNKISSKKKRRMKARTAALMAMSTSAEPLHPTSMCTTNTADEKIPSSDASTAAEHEHSQDAFLHAIDQNSTIYMIEKLEEASASAGLNNPQYMAQEDTKIHMSNRSDDTYTSAWRKTPQNTTHENTEVEVHTNESQKNAATSTDHETSHHTTQKYEFYTSKRSADGDNSIAEEMLDSTMRVLKTFKKDKEQVEAQIHQTFRHEARASDGFTEEEITNVYDFLNFFKWKLEQHDKLFVEMEGLIQSLVAEVQDLHGLSGKYDNVIDDLRNLLTGILDLDIRCRKNTRVIKELKTCIVEYENEVPNGRDRLGMDLTNLPGILRDAKQLQIGVGGLRTGEAQKLASIIGRVQRELNEEVRRIDIDISKYGEINSKVQSSIKNVTTNIFGLQRTSKATKSELQEVVKTVKDLDENVGAIRDTLNKFVEDAHNVPALEQAFAKYDHAMKEMENISAERAQLKEAIDYNRNALKKCNHEILGQLDQHDERLNDCHGLSLETRNVVKKQERHLNTLDNKVNAHQKLIAKVTSKSDSSARRLQFLTDTTARDIKAVSESISLEIRSLSDATSRDIKETFEQLKQTQVQLGTLKTTVDSQARTLQDEIALGKENVKDIVMQLLDPIASKVDMMCAKIESHLEPLNHLSPEADGSPKPNSPMHAQKNNQNGAIAVLRATSETQKTPVSATEDDNSAASTQVPCTSLNAEPEAKVLKVRMPQIDRIMSESTSEISPAASPAPVAPHPSSPTHPDVTAQSPPGMQHLERPEQRTRSLARSERHPQDSPLQERVVGERRDSMQTHNCVAFGDGIREQRMMSPALMNREMLEPPNEYGQVYGQGQTAIAQQQNPFASQQMSIVPLPEPGSQQTGLPSRMFGPVHDQWCGQQQSVQQKFSQQFSQEYDQQYDSQLGLGHDFDFQMGSPLAIIPVDENIQPAAYSPKEDPRDHQLMLLTYNMDNLNARVNEATNAMSVAQSSMRNLRMGLRYEISQDVEREVERRVGTALNRAEARLVQDLNRRINNTERRLNDRLTREEKRLERILPMLEQLMKRDGLELQPPSGN